MSKVSDLHNRAMELTDAAVRDRRQGNGAKAAALFEQALGYEMDALAGLEQSDGLADAILHRSAAWLALDCNQPRLAEKLACQALAGDPDPAIADQLREVLAAAQERLAKDGVFVPAESG